MIEQNEEEIIQDIEEENHEGHKNLRLDKDNEDDNPPPAIIVHNRKTSDDYKIEISDQNNEIQKLKDEIGKLNF